MPSETNTRVKKRLAREKQCAKCPWKVTTDPHDIPNGYTVDAHKKLKATIAEPERICLSHSRVMACHESQPGETMHCIGWLFNQLGPGNNIGLRLQMMSYDLSGVELDGEQHDRFEDTLPKRRRRESARERPARQSPRRTRSR